MPAKVVAVAGVNPSQAPTGVSPNAASNASSIATYVAGSVGDLCLAFVASQFTDTINGPSGWSLVHTSYNGAYGGRVSVFAKVLTSGDVGQIIGFSGGGSCGWLAGTVAVRRFQRKDAVRAGATAVNPTSNNGYGPTQSTITNGQDRATSRYDVNFIALVGNASDPPAVNSVPPGQTVLLYGQAGGPTPGVTLLVSYVPVRNNVGGGQGYETFGFDRNTAAAMLNVTARTDPSGVGMIPARA